MSISKEAIEAGAWAIWARHWPGLDYNAEATIQEHARCHRDANAALTAAAPYIQAAALRDAADDMDWRADRFDRVSDNPKDNDLETIIRYGAYAAVARSSAHRLRARADQLEGETK